jgi:hypothetical protein
MTPSASAANPRPALNITGRLTIDTPRGAIELDADGKSVTLAAPSLRAARHLQRTIDRAGGARAFASEIGAPLLGMADVSIRVKVRGHEIGRIDPNDPSTRRISKGGIVKAAIRLPAKKNRS